uniref:Uncharacterized protein n=1 Tax=Amphimedon queenslandica TaxID=400682 RepID=A0A1X7UTC1_AMPQE
LVPSLLSHCLSFFLTYSTHTSCPSDLGCSPLDSQPSHQLSVTLSLRTFCPHKYLGTTNRRLVVGRL